MSKEKLLHEQKGKSCRTSKAKKIIEVQNVSMRFG